ncbi:MAG: L-fuculose phosphate aldolase [Candidatus Ordinivivax streblomastigis]|uniref:L-fuculose phosphate aldolase n=1 Tax=Candidatus Ordinivivax streblomastigis TaxID=2540710 RepID=A0A5M8P1D9_9BACT|nr:MAG: L-fuculose phosphate aldolase [Candidatus Ordinivivax streblomastigis]
MTKEQAQQFLDAAHRAGNQGLMLCSSGNLSWRIEDDLALISGTGSWVPTIKEENIAVCRISDGQSVEGPRPSIESTFHLGVLRHRKEVNVVLHFQSPFASTVACMKDKPTNFNVTAEIPLHVGREIPLVPYYRPGSPELAQAVTEAMQNHNSILLAKHGQVVCGKDFDDAFQKAVFLEMACEIIVRAGKDNYTTLTEDEIADLFKHFG